MLPDDVLLEIFDFYLDEGLEIDEWITLAHVCRRWRSVVFYSPRRLNLLLLCTPRTPARDSLDIWPPLPLIIDGMSASSYDDRDRTCVYNTIAALDHPDRVCEIQLYDFSSSNLRYVTDSVAMQKPFQELTRLLLRTSDRTGLQ